MSIKSRVPVNAYTRYYDLGLLNGHLDRALGLNGLLTALHSGLPGYAWGYEVGIWGLDQAENP